VYLHDTSAMAYKSQMPGIERRARSDCCTVTSREEAIIQGAKAKGLIKPQDAAANCAIGQPSLAI